MNLKIILTTIAIKLMALTCLAQAYTINHFQSTYDSLSSYNSLTLELLNSGEDIIYWEHKFEFGFDFPFFGETQSDINIASDGVSYFDNSINYNIFLFAAEYTISLNIDTANMHSEIRYIYTTKNNQKAFAIEYHNVFNDEEFWENGENHTINFQYWFYENGTIELRFGDIDLSNCSFYFPGLGFVFDKTDPNNSIYGPWVSINNSDLSEGACFFGDHTNPGILYNDDDNCDVLMSIPPIGYVVQFEYSGNTNVDESALNKDNFFITQKNETIRINGDSKSFQGANIYDILGRKIKYSKEKEFQLNYRKSQIIIVEIITDSGTEIHKVIIE